MLNSVITYAKQNVKALLLKKPNGLVFLFSGFYSSRCPPSSSHCPDTDAPSPPHRPSFRPPTSDIHQPSPGQQSPAPDDNSAARVSAGFPSCVGVISPCRHTNSTDHSTGQAPWAKFTYIFMLIGKVLFYEETFDFFFSVLICKLLLHTRVYGFNYLDFPFLTCILTWCLSL